MLINGTALVALSPIKDMLHEKVKGEKSSHGLTEAGYDIRLKQSIHFKTMFNGFDCVPAIRIVDGYTSDETVKGRFVLASTIEEFTMPNNLVGVVHDKSTWARYGLSVFNTVIEPGWNGFLTLELVYHGKDELIIPAGTGIAQVLFHQIVQESAYSGKYQNQEDKPIPPR